MIRCTDSEAGRLLHAYELRQLSPEDTAIFEEHLLTCNYCFEEASNFESITGLLVSDAEVKSVVERSVEADSKEGILRRLKSIVWPSAMPLALRPAVTYVALALLIYPAYLGLRSASEPAVRSTQTVILSGTRGAAEPSIESAQPLSLVFRVGGNSQNDTLIVKMTDDNGSTLFLDRSFTALSPGGLGTLGFDRNALTSGRYFLTVSNQADSLLVQYTFQID